jgi:hypothetical protein
MPRYNSRARQRNKKMTRSRVVPAFARRRREMQYRERGCLQPCKRSVLIEIADERNDAVRAKPCDVSAITDQAHQMNAVSKPIRNTQRDIAAAYEQNALHRALATFRLALQERMASDAAQEPSTRVPTQLQ